LVNADQYDIFQTQLPVLNLGDVLELGAEALYAAKGCAVFALELVAVAIVVIQRVILARSTVQGICPACAKRHRTCCTCIISGEHPADRRLVFVRFGHFHQL
jgi:hypothetical protein